MNSQSGRTSFATPVLVLVRHCAPGPADVGDNEGRRLSDVGLRQAEDTGRRLATELYGEDLVILSSPYRRCLDTAAAVASACDRDVATDIRLAEARGGTAGDPEQFRQALGRPWGLGDLPGAEPWLSVYERSVSFLSDLPGDRLPVIVTHNSNIHMLCTAWLGLHHEAFDTMAFDAWFGSISVLRWGLFGRGVIERLADTAHLTTGLPPAIGSLRQSVVRDLVAFDQQVKPPPQQ